MDTQAALSAEPDDTANASADASAAAQKPSLSDEDLLPFNLLAMAGAY